MSELLIRAGQVFTAADRDPLLKDAWVRVQDDRIVEVASSEPSGGSAATRVDAPDATLLPGLIDCHVHFAMSGGPDWLSEVKEPYATSCWRAAHHARNTLKAGFTTVRTRRARRRRSSATRRAGGGHRRGAADCRDQHGGVYDGWPRVVDRS